MLALFFSSPYCLIRFGFIENTIKHHRKDGTIDYPPILFSAYYKKRTLAGWILMETCS